MMARFLQGIGLAIFFLPLVQLSLAEIPHNKYASASGLYHFIRILIGGGFGTSLSIEAWTRLEIFHHARLSEEVTVYRPLVQSFYDKLYAYSSNFNFDVTNRVLDRLIEQQAFMLSTNDLCWLGGWLFLLMIPIVYLCRRVKKTSGSVEAAH